MSAFAKYIPEAWPITFHGTLRVRNICGGVPNNPDVVEGWIKSRLGTADAALAQQVAQIMVERGVGHDEAVRLVQEKVSLNGFKRDENGLYIEGRQLKAAIKEAFAVAVAGGKMKSRGWGATNKGLVSFVAEHVCVVEDRLHLGVQEPTNVVQRFVHVYTGDSISREECVEDALISFTILTDYEFTEREWALAWLTGERQGLGSSRSQGYGRYTVESWDRA